MNDHHLKEYCNKKYGATNWKLVFHFPVLYEGWECDSDAYVIEAKEHKYLLMTNHGSFYVSSTKELKERIKEYERVINETRKAIELAK